ncbi:MAG: ABC transporter permease [Chloroflexi bacterium]|nr:ABC transporter permease [Chloroflexota bacterium]
MKPWDSARIAIAALVDNKLRAFLTLLGVVIGVGAVIAVMSIGNGSSAAIQAQIQSIGTNLIFIRPGAPTVSGVRQAVGSGQTLTIQDANAIGDPTQVPDVVNVAPEVNTVAQARAGGQNTRGRVIGVTPSYSDVRGFIVADGRFVSDQDVTSKSSVIVIGANVAQTLFPDSDPIGQSVVMNAVTFKVVGVLQAKGGTAQGLQDDAIIAPITTVQTRLQRNRSANGSSLVDLITAQSNSSGDAMARAKDQIASLLRERHNIAVTDDFVITTQDDLVAARTSVTNVLTILLGATAGTSLFVGGIGIMNIMLVSVTERTREIGIRKAVGAKRRDILTQFLTEATLLSLGGGGIGLGAGYGASKLLAHLTISGTQIYTLISPTIAVLAVCVAAGVGLFFGMYPAIRASRLDPIEALRR